MLTMDNGKHFYRLTIWLLEQLIAILCLQHQDILLFPVDLNNMAAW